MSKKHFDEYYLKVCSQYSEMMDAIREIEKESMTNMMSPERLDELKKSVEPLRNNYMTLSYVAFLLNQPTKPKKQKRYWKSEKKKYSKLDFKRSPQGVMKENSMVIENLHNS